MSHDLDNPTTFEQFQESIQFYELLHSMPEPTPPHILDRQADEYDGD